MAHWNPEEIAAFIQECPVEVVEIKHTGTTFRPVMTIWARGTIPQTLIKKYDELAEKRNAQN